MRRVLLFVEGRTEERFVRQVLFPHLTGLGIFPIATVATTSRPPGSPPFKGGFSSYRQAKSEILRLLGDTSAALITTMIDYYGLPPGFPGSDSVPKGTCHERVAHLERELGRDVGHPRFVPYLQLHEFEALLFAAPAEVARLFPGVGPEHELERIRSSFGSPEEIDDGQSTAPSKRLLALFPEYRKPFHGPLVAQRIGLARIRSECKHFNDWLALLERAGA